MLNLVRGNLLDAEADALVNTVNTVGVMGKGIALQFSKSFPAIVKPYEEACKAGELKIGTVLTIPLSALDGPKYIINVPTKQHWRGDSNIEYVRSGLEALAAEILRLGIKSIAVPPLGCGLGGLKWSDVKPEIESILGPLTDVKILVFEPAGKPAAAAMAATAKKPTLTLGGAALLELMRRYLSALSDTAVTLLESHKLMYFFEESGANAKLSFVKGAYGPYSTMLRHVLTKLEGHFITGFGDASEEPGKILEPKLGAMQAAQQFLQTHEDSQSHIRHVVELIDGFETAFGMELLASVHWVAKHEQPPAVTLDDAVHLVHQWTPRKRSMFTRDHIRIAWERLSRKGWIQGSAGS